MPKAIWHYQFSEISQLLQQRSLNLNVHTYFLNYGPLAQAMLLSALIVIIEPNAVR